MQNFAFFLQMLMNDTVNDNGDVDEENCWNLFMLHNIFALFINSSSSLSDSEEDFLFFFYETQNENT